MHLDVQISGPTFSQLPITIKTAQRTCEKESPRTKLGRISNKMSAGIKMPLRILLFITVGLNNAAVLASLDHFQFIAVV